MYRKVLIVIIIVILGLGNIYFYNQSQKLDYAINIGIPITGSDSTTGIKFYEPLTDKEEASLLIFAFMSGISIEKPKICQKSPNFTIWFNDWDKGIMYRQVNMWLDGNSVIIEIDVNADHSEYRQIDGNRAENLKNIIEKYTINIS